MNKENKVNVSELAGEVCEFLMKILPTETCGSFFKENSLEILTLCVSEVIRAGYCSHQYSDAVKKVVDIINKDLSIKIGE